MFRSTFVAVLRAMLLLCAFLFGGCQVSRPDLPDAAFLLVASSPPAAVERFTPAIPQPVVSPFIFPVFAGFNADGSSVSRGRVAVVDADDERPLAGAWVATSDGRRAITDDFGQFTIPGSLPADGLWAAGAPECYTSVFLGLPFDGSPTLYLRPQKRVWLRENDTSRQAATLSGTVLSPAGQPLSGIAVLLGGPGVEGAIPVLTDARGEFQMSVGLSAEASSNASLLATDIYSRWVGLRTGIVLTGGVQRLAPLTVSPAVHEVQVAVAALNGMQAPRVDLTLVAPDGTRLSLFENQGVHRLARMTGGRYELTIQAASLDGLSESTRIVPNLPIDWSESRTLRSETLLAPPGVPESISLTSTEDTLRWEPVIGAQVYTVEVAPDVPAAVLPWDAFTTRTDLPLALLNAALPKGSYAAQVMAWGSPHIDARELVRERMRPLRFLPRERSVSYARRNFVLVR